MQKGWWAGQLKYSHRCLSSVLFKRRRPSPWNTCTTGAPSSSGRRRLRPVHQDRAISSTFLSDKSIRFKQLYIQIFEFRPLEFLKKLSPSPSYRFPCSQLAAPSEKKQRGGQERLPLRPAWKSIKTTTRKYRGHMLIADVGMVIVIV